MKMDAGVLDDPLGENLKTAQQAVGSDEYRKVAEEAVEKSLVLLKNEGNVLPLKAGTAVWITGPAADHDQAQCGGWTVAWNGSPEKNISGVSHKICDEPVSAYKSFIRIIITKNFV